MAENVVLYNKYACFCYGTRNPMKITKRDVLEYHSKGRPGKIEVIATKPLANQYDLSLAYSPGVAEAVLEVERDPATAYLYTAKSNLVAVISNGTAILGFPMLLDLADHASRAVFGIDIFVGV